MHEEIFPINSAGKALSRRTFFRGSLLAAGALDVAALAQGSRKQAEAAEK